MSFAIYHDKKTLSAYRQCIACLYRACGLVHRFNSTVRSVKNQQRQHRIQQVHLPSPLALSWLYFPYPAVNLTLIVLQISRIAHHSMYRKLTCNSFRRLAESSLGFLGQRILRAARASQSRPENHGCRLTSFAPPLSIPSLRAGFLSNKRERRSW